jgi:hypothetical protein
VASVRRRSKGGLYLGAGLIVFGLAPFLGLWSFVVAGLMIAILAVISRRLETADRPEARDRDRDRDRGHESRPGWQQPYRPLPPPGLYQGPDNDWHWWNGHEWEEYR